METPSTCLAHGWNRADRDRLDDGRHRDRLARNTSRRLELPNHRIELMLDSKTVLDPFMANVRHYLNRADERAESGFKISKKNRRGLEQILRLNAFGVRGVEEVLQVEIPHAIKTTPSQKANWLVFI